MATFNIWENMEAWDDIMGQMIAFVNDTNADIDMAYDWVCEMLDISSFVDNNVAWNSFYNTWESCDNRNDIYSVWFFSLTVPSLTNNMFDDLWSEIADAPGEIYDVIEYKEEWEKDDKFDVEKHINGDIEFWWLHL